MLLTNFTYKSSEKLKILENQALFNDEINSENHGFSENFNFSKMGNNYLLELFQ